MFQHPKGFSPSVPVNPETVSIRPVAAATPVRRLAFGKDWMFLWRRKSLIALTVAMALLLSLGADLVMTPRYRAVSQILIGPVDLRVVEKTVMPPAQTADANVIQVESETRILTSDRVLLRVVDNEKLTSDPEFGAGAPSLMSRLRVSLGFGSQAKTGDAELAALRQLQRSVSAKRSERTYVVDVIVETADRDKSARIANAIAQAYLDEQTAARAEASRRATDSLSSRLSELRERVRNAEEQVELYKREHNIIGPTGRLVDEQQLTELNNQLTTAKARTAEAKARYEQIIRLQRSGADSGSTSEAVQSNTIGRLREQYATIARQEANLAAELGPRHPWVIDARAQVRNAQQHITEELSRVAEANRNDYERALANENSLANSFDVLKRKAMDTSLAFVKLRELEREAEASRAVYESFLGRAREMREQERLDTTNVRILSDAQPPQDRSWPPRRLIILLAGLMLGILGGTGLAYLLELMREHSPPAAQDAGQPARKVA
ncbi:MAG: polysaccharide biosynthesis transport protein [Alphaproteobacteria bacterium]|nr:polysaccharide biosynthesis transport protein [Alphaproteobacteria bacterium]